MSDITWPQNAFPNPSVNYNFKVGTDVIRTQMAGGRARQRRRSTTELRTIQVSWDLTDVQLYIFQSYFKLTLLEGQEYFNINLPLGDTFQSYEARFVIVDNSAFSVSNVGVLNWRLTAVLEVEEIELFDAEELELALLLSPDVLLFISTADELHTLIHETLDEDL